MHDHANCPLSGPFHGSVLTLLRWKENSTSYGQSTDLCGGTIAFSSFFFISFQNHIYHYSCLPSLFWKGTATFAELPLPQDLHSDQLRFTHYFVGTIYCYTASVVIKIIADAYIPTLRGNVIKIPEKHSQLCKMKWKFLQQFLSMK